MSSKFKEVGWEYIDITTTAQRKVARRLHSAGARIESMDVEHIAVGFHAFRSHDEYKSDYKYYGGSLEHCFLEKSLEHYLSILLINPKPGMIGIDIGSCQSVLPDLGKRVYGVQYFKQDLEYPNGIHNDRIGCSADDISLPDGSIDFLTLHCTFEHFENNIDICFVKECARLLRRGGRAVIIPLYMNEVFCNITGVMIEEDRAKINFDNDADYYCIIPEWRNRFGRYYSPEVFMKRVWWSAKNCGLEPCLYMINNWEAIHKDLWLRWILVLDR